MAQFTSDLQVLPAGIRANTATAEVALGAKASTPDGRVFRYCKAGATALVPGKVYDAPIEVANHTNLTCAVAAVGATEITVTLGATAATVDQYAGGVVVINDVDGEGQSFTIESHPAADASATLALTLSDDEPVVTALTTNSQATLVANPYSGVVLHATTEVSFAVGVANTAITAGQYGWIQTRGTVAALCGLVTTQTIGASVAASDTVAGAVEVGDGVLPHIGYAIRAGVVTEYNPVFLTID